MYEIPNGMLTFDVLQTKVSELKDDKFESKFIIYIVLDYTAVKRSVINEYIVESDCLCIEGKILLRTENNMYIEDLKLVGLASVNSDLSAAFLSREKAVKYLQEVREMENRV